MLIEEKLESIEQYMQLQLESIGNLVSALDDLRRSLDESRDDCISSSYSIVVEHTGWSEKYARKQVKAGLVPCRHLGGEDYEFSVMDLRRWNARGRPSVHEFYATYQTSNP